MESHDSLLEKRFETDINRYAITQILQNVYMEHHTNMAIMTNYQNSLGNLDSYDHNKIQVSFQQKLIEMKQ